MHVFKFSWKNAMIMWLIDFKCTWEDIKTILWNKAISNFPLIRNFSLQCIKITV